MHKDKSRLVACITTLLLMFCTNSGFRVSSLPPPLPLHKIVKRKNLFLQWLPTLWRCISFIKKMWSSQPMKVLSHVGKLYVFKYTYIPIRLEKLQVEISSFLTGMAFPHPFVWKKWYFHCPREKLLTGVWS